MMHDYVALREELSKALKPGDIVKVDNELNGGYYKVHKLDALRAHVRPFGDFNLNATNGPYHLKYCCDACCFKCEKSKGEWDCKQKRLGEIYQCNRNSLYFKKADIHEYLSIYV